MGLRLLGTWEGTAPSTWMTEDLSTVVTSFRFKYREHSICEQVSSDTPISERPVICSEPSGEGWVSKCPDGSLGGGFQNSSWLLLVQYPSSLLSPRL